MVNKRGQFGRRTVARVAAVDALSETAASSGYRGRAWHYLKRGVLLAVVVAIAYISPTVWRLYRHGLLNPFYDVILDQRALFYGTAGFEGAQNIMFEPNLRKYLAKGWVSGYRSSFLVPTVTAYETQSCRLYICRAMFQESVNQRLMKCSRGGLITRPHYKRNYCKQKK